MHHAGVPQALPRACSLLGSLLAIILLWLVAAMTWVSISRGIVHPASELLQIAEQEEHPHDTDDDDMGGGCGIVEELSPLHPRPPVLVSYSGLVRTYLGHRAAQVFNTFLIANALG